MEPLFYVMAILGCGDGAAACQEARVEPVRYENAAQCHAAMEPALLRNSDLAFPTIAANCQSNAARISQKRDKRSAG